ncbi:hypothetical protein ACGFWE_00055 [Streptomyces sp. NPDC048523]|uniref:hypothetical protein n=1 Tax=Streptomyces sp. NPDC048523 TaxID=3365567 RepID=UPI00371C0B2B
MSYDLLSISSITTCGVITEVPAEALLKPAQFVGQLHEIGAEFLQLGMRQIGVPVRTELTVHDRVVAVAPKTACHRPVREHRQQLSPGIKRPVSNGPQLLDEHPA